jgi:hypothetical protein
MDIRGGIDRGGACHGGFAERCIVRFSADKRFFGRRQADCVRSRAATGD